MNAIGLHQRRLLRHTLEQPRDQRHAGAGGNRPIDFTEPLDERVAIIRGQPDPGEHHPGAGVAGLLDHRDEILAHGVERNAAQAVIPAKRDDDVGGLMGLEGGRQSCASPGGRLAADRGIDDIGLRAQIIREAGHPARLGRHIVGSREAVTQNQHPRVVGRGGMGR